LGEKRGSAGQRAAKGQSAEEGEPKTSGAKDTVIPTYSETPIWGLPQNNHDERVERLGFLTPAEARAPVLTPEAA